MTESAPDSADKKAVLTAELAGYQSAKEALKQEMDARLAAVDLASERAAIVDHYTPQIEKVRSDMAEAQRQIDLARK